MKMFRRNGVAAGVVGMACILLTACLNDSERTSTQQMQFAVIGTSKTYQTVATVQGYGPLYSQALQSTSLMPGQCCFIDYTINFDSPENQNAAANGYYVATIGNIKEITRGYVVPQLADTAKMMEDEIVVPQATIDDRFGFYVDYHLLLFTKIKQLKNQQTEWRLYYDPLQEAKVESQSSNDRYYDVFVRAVKRVAGEGVAENDAVVPMEYDIKECVKLYISKEKSENQKYMNLKINYLSEINPKDSADLKWSSFTIKGFPVEE